MRRPQCTSHKKRTREGAQNVQRLPQQDTINMRLSKSIPRRDLFETRTSKLCALHSRHLFSSTLTFVRPTQLCADPCPLRTRFVHRHSPPTRRRVCESGDGFPNHCPPEGRSVIHAAVSACVSFLAVLTRSMETRMCLLSRILKDLQETCSLPNKRCSRVNISQYFTQVASSETVLFTERTTKNEAPNSRARGTAVSNCVQVLRCQSGRSREHARSPS